ncbi:hypothetical protein [Guillardia theta]|uniref:Ycf20 n=1 Tax=Guillardia theta TaxID=55529 RepID=Q9AW17_GUITH|nr:hypothetical protein GTHECHR2163 [Guillardia theta]CAC27054.1 hypothetical protein [Guillardia theta]|mmetsp:Transcript_23967/g.77923  ORF Transcript_23967/g.77923 Transcript_23967/m.77923 type:complete len:126 (-) Transcript_23967:204-581(-)
MLNFIKINSFIFNFVKNDRKINYIKNFSLRKKKNNFFIHNNLKRDIYYGSFFLLFGFFSATSAITIIGSVADWDPLAAAVMLCWIEVFNKIFYKNISKKKIFNKINIFKIGINLGIFVDAFKLTG